MRKRSSILVAILVIVLVSGFSAFFFASSFTTTMEYDSSFKVLDYVNTYSVDINFPKLADYGTRGYCQSVNNTHVCYLTLYLSLNLNGTPPSNFYVKSMTVELHNAVFSSIGLLLGTDDGSIESSHSFQAPDTQVLTISPWECGGCTWTETIVIYNAPLNSNGTIILGLTLGAQIVESGFFNAKIHVLNADITLPNSTAT